MPWLSILILLSYDKVMACFGPPWSGEFLACCFLARMRWRRMCLLPILLVDGQKGGKLTLVVLSIACLLYQWNPAWVPTFDMPTLKIRVGKHGGFSQKCKNDYFEVVVRACCDQPWVGLVSQMYTWAGSLCLLQEWSEAQRGCEEWGGSSSIFVYRDSWLRFEMGVAGVEMLDWELGSLGHWTRRYFCVHCGFAINYPCLWVPHVVEAQFLSW